MNISKRRLISAFGIIQIVVPVLITGVFLLLGQILIGLCAAVIMGLGFVLFYGAMNKITFNETSITEKTMFGSKTLQWNETQQAGLIFRANKKRFLIKESLAPLDANHTEIYIINYRTVDPPDFTDGGKRIILDYNSTIWQSLKNNPQLHIALKHGELAASKTKLSLF